MNYPYPNVGEETFKNSKWTICFNMTCHHKTPWEYILIQAPQGVAVDVLRNGFGIDPEYIDCDEHQSKWSLTDNAEWPDWLFRNSSNLGVFIVRHDGVGYYANGIWKKKT